MHEEGKATDEQKARIWWLSLSRQERNEWTEEIATLLFNQGLEPAETEDQILKAAYESENA